MTLTLLLLRNLPRVRILNSTMGRYQHHYLRHAIASNSYRQQHPPKPQVYRVEKWGHIANSSDNAKTMKTWTLLCNGRVTKGAINLPRFALAKQQLTVLRPGKQSNRGTGVFLPRTEAYNQMNGQTKTPWTSCAELSRQQCQQKQQQKLHIHANALVTQMSSRNARRRKQMLHLMISLMSSAYQMNGSIDDAIHELHQ